MPVNVEPGGEYKLDVRFYFGPQEKFFFFQAEDGIRDHCVTGVQTCALPISHVPLWLLEALTEDDLDALDECLTSGMLVHSVEGVAFRHELARLAVEDSLSPTRRLALHRRALRSEERRVGKECRSRWWP